jgi:hypothetical protein
MLSIDCGREGLTPRVVSNRPNARMRGGVVTVTRVSGRGGNAGSRPVPGYCHIQKTPIPGKATPILSCFVVAVDFRLRGGQPMFGGTVFLLSLAGALCIPKKGGASSAPRASQVVAVFLCSIPLIVVLVVAYRASTGWALVAFFGLGSGAWARQFFPDGHRPGLACLAALPGLACAATFIHNPA